MPQTRRDFCRYGAAGGAGLLTFVIAGCERKLTPAAAKAQDIAYRTLSAAEVKTLETLGEVLLPGSAAEGLAHYIDHQLSGPLEDSMLMIRYLGVNAPFAPFYQAGLAAAEAASLAQFKKPLTQLNADDARTLVGSMAGGRLENWKGPPAALVYFVLRSDAADVVYGTPAGFEKLSVPYMPHIPPQSRWGE